MRGKLLDSDSNTSKTITLCECEAMNFASKFQLPVLKCCLATTREEVKAKCEEIGFPVVIKIFSPQILHKTDVEGVKLNIQNSVEAEKAFDEIVKNVKSQYPQAEIKGVAIYPQVKKGFELIIGGLNDENFGPTVMVGVGGIFTELFKDVSFRIAPVSTIDAEEMLRELKVYPLFEGYRGKSLDKNAVIQIILNTSKMMMETSVYQVDFNPVIVYEKGAVIVDAKILLRL